MRFGLRLAIALSISSTAPGQIVDSNPNPLFAGFTNSEPYKNYLQSALNSVEPVPLRAQCPSLTVIDFNKYLIVETPTFVREQGNYNIDSGKWIARVIVDRCGTQSVRRVLLEAIPGGMNITADFGRGL